MDILSLGYLGFETDCHEEWLSFGPKIIGLGVGKRGADGAVYLKMDDRRFRFAFHPGNANKLKYVGWELRDALSFQAALKKLKEHEVRFELASPELLRERGVTGMASFEDPAGFPHEIFYGQAFWPNSFIPGRPISGFLSQDMLGLGHIILGVPEFKDSYRDFAVNVLGFNIFAGYPVRMPEGHTERLEFYKCNARTHVLGYIPYSGRKGIQHVGLDMMHLDDVGTCIDLCAKHDVPIMGTLGRNVMDDTVSFYFKTPTGFLVECGYGPRLEENSQFLAQMPDGQPHAWGHVMYAEHEATTLVPVK